MFLRAEGNRLNSINLDNIRLQEDDERLPDELAGLIYPAIDAREFSTLAQLYRLIENQHAETISPKRIEDELCYSALACHYNTEDFNTILDIIKLFPDHEVYFYEYSYESQQLEAYSMPLLHLAIHHGRKEVANDLLNQGAEIEQTDRQGRTAMNFLEQQLQKQTDYLQQNPQDGNAKKMEENLRQLKDDFEAHQNKSASLQH